jgi:very-short-patch-repair endonuclease
MLYYKKELQKYSRKLRKNMTIAENRLWFHLRGKQLCNRQFYRQKIIGNYIVDFYCPRANLVIELDGGQHFTESGIKKDYERDSYFKDLNLRVLRFSDCDIFDNISGVIEKIVEYL